MKPIDAVKETFEQLRPAFESGLMRDLIRKLLTGREPVALTKPEELAALAALHLVTGLFLAEIESKAKEAEGPGRG